MVKNFIDTFITKASLHPSKPAIIFLEKEISYQELHERSNSLAQYLISHEAASEDIIPLILERDPNIIISMLGILKAGCAFLPISPITPEARIKFILEDTKAKFLISNINLESYSINPNIQLIDPSNIKEINNSIATITNPHHLAYVMYTSGSTGNPKGVLIEHQAMMNLFSSLISILHINHKEVFLALTDYTFDISLIELLMPLLCGATILLTEQGTVADGLKIKRYLKKNKVTFMQATPLTWDILLKQSWKNDGNTKIVVGGEKFKASLANLLDYKKGNIWNAYGPTETSMWSMMYHLNDIITTDSIPLGMPLANTIIEVLDAELNNVTSGAQGELYIGGIGLARGYLNNKALTDEKFIYHPKTKIKLYKTGDVVSLNDDKTICYLGRIDDQLKFGGIRIEAGEIESVIEQEPFVKRAIVKVHETEGYYKSLAAYIEVDEEKIFANGVQTTGNDISLFLKNIYDETYLHAKEYEHGTMNNCGWQSSFTGQLFDIKELSESYEYIREVINNSDLSNVLEVGCGTGSLFLEYIEKVEECSIVEISTTAIEYVKNRLSKEQLEKVIFRNESVLNIHDHHKYSCVIINSVIQYLPSIHYLITSLTQLIHATKENGTIIIGDVRSIELLDVYLLEKIRANSTDAEDLNLSTFYYKSRDAEIVLSPKFFYALKNSLKEISHIDISIKHGSYKNELNYFRYDVILHINKPITYIKPKILEFTSAMGDKTIEDLIKTVPNTSFIIKKIPNIYIQDFLKVINKDLPSYLSLPLNEQNASTSEKTNHIKSLINIKLPLYEKFVHYDASDSINFIEIHLYPIIKNKILRFAHNEDYKNYRMYCREPFNPWLQKFCFEHIKLKVKQHVVSWVNPSVYVWIEKWPLSINSKLDKKRLQLPVNETANSNNSSILEQLQIMWRNITGDNALVDKEFWIHGISSLSMYFFLATINETFLVNINYHEFRDYNTLDKLANYIEKLLGLSEN